MSDGKIKGSDLVQSDALQIYDELKTKAVSTLAAISKALVKLEKAQKAVGITTNEQTRIQREQRIELNKLSIAAKEAKNADDKLSQAKKQAILDLRKQTAETKAETAAKKTNTKATENQGKANKGLTATFKNLLQSMLAFIGVRMFIQAIKDTFNLVKTLDSLRFAMTKIADSFIVVADNAVFLRRITKAYGADLITTTERYIKFLAAAKQSNVTLKDTQNIFESVTKASGVLGLKTDELRGVYLALEQMLSKGKVTTEELRRQLGERLPGAMGIMASALDVTIPKLDQMLKKGEILSADALPKFAKALEVAYGIESLNKVDTLISAQTRLKNSWDLFVKAVASGDSVITRALKNTLTGLEFILTKLALISQDFTLSLETKTIDETILIRSKILKSAIKLVEAKTGITKKGLQKELELAKKNIEDGIALSDKEKDKLNEIQRVKLNELIAFNDIVDKQQEESAKKEFDRAKSSYLIQKKKFDDLIVEKAKFDKLVNEGIQTTDNGDGTFTMKILTKDEAKIVKTSLENTNRELEKQVDIFSKVRAEFFEIRKLSQGSTKAVKPDEDKDKDKKLRDIEDLQNKIRAKELQSQIESNNILLKAEETSFTLKAELIQRNADLEKSIDDLILEDKLDSINKKADEEIKLFGKTSERGIELEKERNQLLELERQDHAAKIIDIEEGIEGDLDKIREDESKRVIEFINIKKEELEIAKDKELAIARKLSTSKEDLAKRTANIEKKFFELEKTEMISIYENLIEHLKTLKIDTTELEKILDRIKNKSFVPNLDDTKNKFEKILDLASQFNQALGDLSSAFSDRRLEQIDYEIQLEENKYDRLLELAEGDKAQQESIQREKDAALAKLEKKRLKEEQKAAKLRKASAIADIAINTAIGISNAGKKGFLGIPEVAWVAALGALQIATVLAQPIPKFAEGGTMEYDGKAMINDGGNREYVERGGVIFSTPIKNAVVDLQKGDKVHKDMDSLMNASIMTSLANDNKNLDATKLKAIFDTNYNGLENAITKSLSKARFNNNIKLNGFDSGQEAYRNSQSRWS